MRASVGSTRPPGRPPSSGVAVNLFVGGGPLAIYLEYKPGSSKREIVSDEIFHGTLLASYVKCRWVNEHRVRQIWHALKQVLSQPVVESMMADRSYFDFIFKVSRIRVAEYPNLSHLEGGNHVHRATIYNGDVPVHRFVLPTLVRGIY